MIKIRPYQEACIRAVFSQLKTEDNALVVLPTGAGKTFVFCKLIELIKKFKPEFRALIIVNKAILVSQTVEELEKFIPANDIGVFSASFGLKQYNKPITVGTIQSLYRQERSDKIDLVIIDEVHRLDSGRSSSIYMKYINKLRTAYSLKLIGFTATPFREDGEIFGEGKLFKKPTYSRSIKEMIDDGFLVPIIYKSATVKARLDLKKIRTTAGEYNQKDLDELMSDEEKINIQIPDCLTKLEGRKKIVYSCVTINHAKMIHEKLLQLGHSPAIVHSLQSTKKRASNLDSFRYGMCRHLVFVTLVAEGFNFPPIDAIVAMRPTRSPTFYIQLAGRGLRTFPEKEDLLFLDYGGIVENLGHIYNVTANAEKKYCVICPMCDEVMFEKTTKCLKCNYLFHVEQAPERKKNAVTKNLHSYSAGGDKYPQWVNVGRVEIREHLTKKGAKCFKVMYFSNGLYERWIANDFIFNKENLRADVKRIKIDLVKGYRNITEREFE